MVQMEKQKKEKCAEKEKRRGHYSKGGVCWESEDSHGIVFRQAAITQHHIG